MSASASFLLSPGGGGRCRAFDVVLVFLLAAALLCSVGDLSASALDFDVGGEDGWEVPPSNNTQFYNQWASKNRFQVDDVLVFKYRKDSVMVVTEGDYGLCNSSHPAFFDNRGSTEVELDRAGAFYFISGNAGHCELGQRMVVKVLPLRDDDGGDGAAGSSPPSAADQPGTTTPPGVPSHGAAAATGWAVSAVLLLLLVGHLSNF